MKVTEFNIGDRVRVKDYCDIPEEHQSRGFARLCGEIGEITDKLYSEGNQGYVYSIQFDNYTAKSVKMWKAELLDLVDESVSYSYEFEYLDNLVVARLFELREDSKTEIARGHGHIIHEGVVGIAQAASYALKRIYYKMSGQEEYQNAET